MTYDITLRKNGKEFPTPMTIHGMSYGSKGFDWMEGFVFGEYRMPFKEVEVKAKKFHKLFVKYCKSITWKEGDTYFGGDSTGCYYDSKKLSKDDIINFAVAKRWLDVYITALAFKCDIDFH